MASDRDQALKRTEQRAVERAKRVGYSDRDARKMAREATEKTDAQKKKLGHW